MRMSRLVVVLAALVVPFAVSAATVDVSVDNFAFTPPSVDVAPGDTVRWTFLSLHTTTRDTPAGAEAWDSGFRSSGTFTHVFSNVGDWSYHCTLHPFMTGVVHVINPGPTITFVTPPSAFPSTTVTITGTNFQNGATVTFRGVASPSVTFVSATELQAIVPAIASGSATVVVTNPNQTTASFVGFVVAAQGIPTLSREVLLLLAIVISAIAFGALRR